MYYASPDPPRACSPGEGRRLGYPTLPLGSERADDPISLNHLGTISAASASEAACRRRPSEYRELLLVNRGAIGWAEAQPQVAVATPARDSSHLGDTRPLDSHLCLPSGPSFK